MTDAEASALAGIRVLDLTSVIMGPFATQILADLGAEVIHVEPPRGDINRQMGAGPHPQLSGMALNLLRNKRSLSVDLKTDAGRALLLRLAATCDVFVTNLRPGPLGRLGAAYEHICDVRPDVVYCQSQGFPTDSARADEPAYDDIIQSASGIADLTLRAYGKPVLLPTIFADKVAGLTIVYAVLAALLHRQRTGEGQRIEVPMVDAVRSFLLVEHGAAAITEPPLGPPGYPRILTPERRPQETSDGLIDILPYSQAHYDAIFTAGGRDDLVGDPRTATAAGRIEHAGFLYSQVREIVATRTTSEWLGFCREHSIPATAVPRLDDLVAELPLEKHPVAGEYRHVPLGARLSGTPQSVRSPAPLVGADSDAILHELGLSEPEIRELHARGVVASPAYGSPGSGDGT